MKPYYEHGGITLFNADCRDVLPDMGADLLLTDPPYGIGRDGKRPSTSSHNGHKGYEFRGWDSEPPDEAMFGAMFSAATDYVVWGANYYPQHFRPSAGWLVWDKGQRIDQADGEIAASSREGALRILTLNRIELAFDGAVHPTQKPLALMKWCIRFFPFARTILDPFAGSGTSLRAAKDMGLQAVGVEIDERYCEIAAKRMAQEVLFAEEPLA